ncbi:hypothetical protein [Actinomadura rubrisoli]|uniref:hypothetical protein n=1 Tax=Actinomadura rubrisoli TaxID=2530368 RepID=UPI001A9E5939|nr:hypothetical protein [Actinomadura rubrisoli]
MRPGGDGHPERDPPAAAPQRRFSLIDTGGRAQVSLPASFTCDAAEILRGDLADILYARAKHAAEYMFDDSIASMTETPDGVTFEHGAPRTFDQVFGADGLRSNVQRLAFAEETEFPAAPGHHVAIGVRLRPGK